MMATFLGNVTIAVVSTIRENHIMQKVKGIFAVVIAIQNIGQSFYQKKNSLLLALGIMHLNVKREGKQERYLITILETNKYNASLVKYVEKKLKLIMMITINHWMSDGYVSSIIENGIKFMTTQSCSHDVPRDVLFSTVQRAVHRNER